MKQEIDKAFVLNKVKCFIFDMDGTIYSGDKIYEGVIELFRFFLKKNIKFYFLTNNSSKTGSIYVEKLRRLGVDFISENQIITSGDVTIKYLQKKKYNKIYLVGTSALEKQFIDAGFELVYDKYLNIDCVVVGFDTSFNFKKGEIATYYLRKEIPFISTNEDLVCPIENNEFIPDCGSITALLEKASNRTSEYLGKPRYETFNYLLEYTRLNKDEIAIVGDRLYTDIATGFYNDFTSIAVLTGEFKLEDLIESSVKPTIILDNVFDIYRLLNNS
jgi:HAD superfamily hydrolase (TIGR01450 family)